MRIYILYFCILNYNGSFLGSPAKYNSPPGPTIVALVLSTLAIEPNGIDSPLLSLTVKSAFFPDSTLNGAFTIDQM